MTLLHQHIVANDCQLQKAPSITAWTASRGAVLYQNPF